jgi:hypothetical protein
MRNQNDSNNEDSDIAQANITTGMALPGGAMVEQLSGRNLLLYAEGEERIGATIEYAGRHYRPVRFDNELEDALHLPQATAEFDGVGSLLKKIANAMECHARLDAPTNLLVASFTLATWVAEFLPTVPVLNVWGTSGTETALWTLLTHLCRRPLRLVDPSLRQLSQLPRGLAPTILLRRLGDTALRRLLSICDDGEVLYGNGLLRICSPIVVFTARPVSVPALRLRLPASRPPYGRIAQSQIEELRQIQRQLVRYRVTRYQQVAQSNFDAPGFCPETRVIARILGACAEGDESVQQQIVAALQDQDEGAKVISSHSVEAVVLEALLVLIHEKRSHAFITEIKKLTEGILLGRQQITALVDRDMGRMLREDLGLSTTRRSKGICLSLNTLACAAIHREAYARGVLTLLEPRPDCSYCNQLVADVPLAEATSGPVAACTPYSLLSKLGRGWRHLDRLTH